MTLTYGSLFSGVGGIDLGLDRAGMTCLWQVEIDPFCRQVLTKHWPDVPKYADITTLDFTEVEPVDLICGGFPCQPVSLAGKRLGQDDARWLWPEFARAIRVVRPRYALMENVPGLLGLGMGDVLRDLSALGFDAEWSIVSACSMGAPHTRERLFIVGYPGGAGRKEQRWTESVRAQFAFAERSGWWATEPAMGRMADGVPYRVGNLKAFGNAVVPQVAEWIGRRIMESDLKGGETHCDRADKKGLSQ